jgi:hypothetical protein
MTICKGVCYAFSALITGVAVYALGRQNIPVCGQCGLGHFDRFDTLANISGPFPSLLHTYAFALLLALILGETRRSRDAVIGAWLVVACTLELTQTKAASLEIDLLAHRWLAPGVADWAGRAFLNSTFDYFDLAGNIVGAGLAKFQAQIKGAAVGAEGLRRDRALLACVTYVQNERRCGGG